MSTASGEIRRASLDDVDSLLALDGRATTGDTERRSAIRAHVGSGCCWVHCRPAQSDGTRLDAYAVLLPRHFFGRDFLELLMVASWGRRMGVGTALMRALLDLEGTGQVFTSTNRSNTPMRALLRKEGWDFSGELDGLDAEDPEMFFLTTRASRKG